MAQAFLKNNPGAKIVHDPRLTWNTVEMVKDSGGVPVMCKAGHAFIKERMRREDALYGGEMSAHHYFRDFAYCDSGMIPWLLLVETLSASERPLSELVRDRIARYPVSGEINLQVSDPQAVLQDMENHYKNLGGSMDHTDGLTVELNTWRFNLRPSNTEPVIRLNVETRHDMALLKEKTEEILERVKNTI
jgi:phosphomannomutase